MFSNFIHSRSFLTIPLSAMILQRCYRLELLPLAFDRCRSRAFWLCLKFLTNLCHQSIEPDDTSPLFRTAEMKSNFKFISRALWMWIYIKNDKYKWKCKRITHYSVPKTSINETTIFYNFSIIYWSQFSFYQSNKSKKKVCELHSCKIPLMTWQIWSCEMKQQRLSHWLSYSFFTANLRSIQSFLVPVHYPVLESNSWRDRRRLSWMRQFVYDFSHYSQFHQWKCTFQPENNQKYSNNLLIFIGQF